MPNSEVLNDARRFIRPSISFLMIQSRRVAKSNIFSVIHPLRGPTLTCNCMYDDMNQFYSFPGTFGRTLTSWLICGFHMSHLDVCVFTMTPKIILTYNRHFNQLWCAELGCHIRLVGRPWLDLHYSPNYSNNIIYNFHGLGLKLNLAFNLNAEIIDQVLWFFLFLKRGYSVTIWFYTMRSSSI